MPWPCSSRIFQEGSWNPDHAGPGPPPRSPCSSHALPPPPAPCSSYTCSSQNSTETGLKKNWKGTQKKLKKKLKKYSKKTQKKKLDCQKTQKNSKKTQKNSKKTQKRLEKNWKKNRCFGSVFGQRLLVLETWPPLQTPNPQPHSHPSAWTSPQPSLTEPPSLSGDPSRGLPQTPAPTTQPQPASPKKTEPRLLARTLAGCLLPTLALQDAFPLPMLDLKSSFEVVSFCATFVSGKCVGVSGCSLLRMPQSIDTRLQQGRVWEKCRIRLGGSRLLSSPEWFVQHFLSGKSPNKNVEIWKM